MKTVTIKNIYKEPLTANGEKKVRMNICIATDRREDVLWYEVDEQYGSCLCDDRCDGIVVSIFLTAMRFGFEAIKSSYPISEKLYYNLTYHVIPHFYKRGRMRGFPKIKIEAETTAEKYDGKAVVTGMSQGVDSFATLYEYGKNFELEDYRLTHFCYHNIGAHHGSDPLTGNSQYTSRELYDGQLQKTKEFCQKYGYELVIVDSNLNDILGKVLGGWAFDRTHTYRNLGTALILQKLYKRYYYASTYDLGQFRFAFETDSAKYERWVIPYLGTESLEFYSANQEWSRQDKIERIVKMEESYDYLHVCLVGIKNCGRCLKCKRTLMGLDAVGGEALDKYKNSFDIDYYKQNQRAEWFSRIYEDKSEKAREPVFYREIYDCAAEHNPALVPEPELEICYEAGRKLVVKVKSANLKALPSAKAKLISREHQGAEFECIGKWEKWFKVKRNGEQTGYIFEALVELTELADDV